MLAKVDPAILPDAPKGRDDAPKGQRKAFAATEWFVVNTNPRCEDRAARGLSEAGFTVFLPTYQVKVRRRFGMPSRLALYPLLTGYLFLEMATEDADWYAPRRIDGVRKVLGMQQDAEGYARRPVGVKRKDVEEFMRLCASGALSPKDPERRPFAAGDKVFIKSGPFRGQVVHLDDVTGSKSARFLTAVFGRLTPVDIGLDDIRHV